MEVMSLRILDLQICLTILRTSGANSSSRRAAADKRPLSVVVVDEDLES